ncbi:MAG: fibrobacter succinogenes major paralogous domain-containing protein [Bacteroidota bacterium]
MKKVSLILIILGGFSFVTYAQTVTIGTQVWMTKNLNVDKFRNGDPIPHAKTKKEWKNAVGNGQPAWCYYNNDPANGLKYGRLYNWYAVNDPRGLAPIGWHIPNDEEWTVLENYLGDEAGKKMKTKYGWKAVDEDMGGVSGDNESGFSALPAGGFSGNEFYEQGSSTYYWSLSKKYPNVWLYYWFGNLQKWENDNNDDFESGYSVRCIKD